MASVQEMMVKDMIFRMVNAFTVAQAFGLQKPDQLLTFFDGVHDAKKEPINSRRVDIAPHQSTKTTLMKREERRKPVNPSQHQSPRSGREYGRMQKQAAMYRGEFTGRGQLSNRRGN